MKLKSLMVMSLAAFYFGDSGVTAQEGFPHDDSTAFDSNYSTSAAVEECEATTLRIFVPVIHEPSDSEEEKKKNITLTLDSINTDKVSGSKDSSLWHQWSEGCAARGGCTKPKGCKMGEVKTIPLAGAEVPKREWAGTNNQKIKVVEDLITGERKIIKTDKPNNHDTVHASGYGTTSFLIQVEFVGAEVSCKCS